MSKRLSKGGRLLDRSAMIEFSFNGKMMLGYQGDTLASALLASGQMLVGRSFKYHRPRGIMASGAEEPNALVTLGRGSKVEPNQRATTTELVAGLEAHSQNHWPSLSFDIGAVNRLLSPLLPAGFYYKTFIKPRAAWAHIFEPLIRHSAGLGKAPKEPDADHYDFRYAHCDLLIAGGGVAGLQAALLAAKSGAKVILAEQSPHWGGRAPVDGDVIDGLPAQDWVAKTLAELTRAPNVSLQNRMMVAGVYDHGYALAEESLSGDGPRKRLWRIRARAIFAATGAIERPLSFAGNDLPKVMLASAMRDYIVNHAISPGDRVALVTNNDDAYRTAFALQEVGLAVPVIVDVRLNPQGDLPKEARRRGIRIEEGRAVVKVLGSGRVRGVSIGIQAGEGAALEEIRCDALAMSGGWSPVVHLYSQAGGKLLWDEGAAMFRPDPDRPPRHHDGQAMVYAGGAANGALKVHDCLRDAADQAIKALAALGFAPKGEAAKAEAIPEEAVEPCWLMPAKAGPQLQSKIWLDWQNDVKASDVALAAQEGYASVEHTKRYTTLGMATDQGKLSNINGLALLARALEKRIPEVGTTTFRPPYTPVTFGALAGEARGALFQPLRKTPLHQWHLQNGAQMEPVGLWRRPYAYLRPLEAASQAAQREARNTRQNVGIFDASSLGKIMVKGPDAGRFLDMLYTNVMSNLPLGKCRYGLMLNEQGFLMDDGVVIRLTEDTWLCHTTTGGADRIHAWMEDWLQCEWHDWKVFTANLTEQSAQIVIAGPKARELLQSLGGMDLSPEALAHMSFAEGQLGDFKLCLHRISFSGELAYEIALPARQALAFWQACLAAGAPLGLMPYGTEAMHILRAEKGYIMIGDETDGTIIPQDLHLTWALSKTKEDFIGKRGLMRAHLAGSRWQLVGLEPEDGRLIDEGAYIPAEGRNDYGFQKTQGRVTSSYLSPNLGRGFALALIAGGKSRIGEQVELTRLDGGRQKAKVVAPIFYDPEGVKLHG